MAYTFTRNDAATVTASELVVSIFDTIEAAFRDVRYGKILWRNHILPESINTNINPGSLNYVYRSRDFSGHGQFTNGDVRNIPRVIQRFSQITIPIADAAISAEVTNTEARRYVAGNLGNLPQDLGMVMRRAVDFHLERTFFFGDLTNGFESYLDYPNVTITPVATWVGQDPTVWVRNINDAITDVWINSKQEHLPDTVEMPLSLLAKMQEAMVIGSGSVGLAVSALKYLAENNMYTLQTRKPLNIVPLRYLDGAGVNGADRIIVKENKAENAIMPFPMPFQLAQPVPINLGSRLLAEYIFGSYNIPYPGSLAYIDVAQSA